MQDTEALNGLKQGTDQAQVSNFQQNQFGNTYAFTLQDVMCVTATNSRLSIHQALNSPQVLLEQ
jgi:hypothetical protein